MNLVNEPYVHNSSEIIIELSKTKDVLLKTIEDQQKELTQARKKIKIAEAEKLRTKDLQRENEALKVMLQQKEDALETTVRHLIESGDEIEELKIEHYETLKKSFDLALRIIEG